MRICRELRIELEAPPPAPEWPDGLRVVAFDPEHDALEFHAAGQEAFADHWDHTPRDIESWSKSHFGSERFDPTLWCVVRAGDEIAAGTIFIEASEPQLIAFNEYRDANTRVPDYLLRRRQETGATTTVGLNPDTKGYHEPSCASLANGATTDHGKSVDIDI